jgi:hypothetical protein
LLLAEHGRNLLRHHHHQAIRRGTFTSVEDLETAIRGFIDSYNQRAKPFTWTKTAEDIVAKPKSTVNR